ncbi:hypothetical protein EDD22DRAFT_1047940 [Suillus occidentalis]|nr:hypothetical protein EDD22DRAFT_1047940 [Suillus occidentalis]
MTRLGSTHKQRRPVLDEHGLHNGKFVCSKDGMVLNPECYLKHIRTAKHLGYKLERFKWPMCSKTYARRDACKRHFNDSKCTKAAVGGVPPSFSAGPASAVAGALQLRAMPTFAVPGPCLPQLEINTVSEPVEDDEDDEDKDDADSWENNEMWNADEM